MIVEPPILSRPTRRAAVKALLCAVLLGAAVGTGATHAQIRPFSVHDTNRDGHLDREEYRVLLEMRRARHRQRRIDSQPAPAFDEVDDNRDGLVDEGELIEALQHRMYRYGRRGPHWRYPADATR
jgi:Ca2+-binding EF-hand superfamily protein